MRHLVADEGLDKQITVESSGTSSWNVGSGPDPRSQAEAGRRGIAMGGTARQFEVDDFARLDLILAMDHQNAAELRRQAPDDAARAKVRLLREFDPSGVGAEPVPDPYYGGEDGFVDVFDMVEAACRGLLDHLRSEGDRTA